MQKGFTYFAAAVVVLVLIKDGTAGTLIGNAATFGQNLAKGVRPLATAA